jgi:hypothetical protein
MKALFITVKDLKERSIVDGNTDADKLIHFIEVAQDIHIQNYLGGRLYDKFQTIILNGTINDPVNSDYKSLRDEYIKPMLIWFTQVEYFPFADFSITNSGLSRTRSENEDGIGDTEILRMESKLRDRAEHYTNRFVDYMCFNSTKFPEYTQNQNGDMYPDRDPDTFSSFVL